MVFSTDGYVHDMDERQVSYHFEWDAVIRGKMNSELYVGIYMYRYYIILPKSEAALIVLFYPGVLGELV